MVVVAAAHPDVPRPPDESSWTAPPVRGDALLLTWGMMLLGHVLVGVLAVFALAGGARDHSAASVVSFWVLLTLGVAGGYVASCGLRVTLTVRRAERQNRAPEAPSPSLLVLAVGVALLAVSLAVIVLVQWGAGGVLPAVGGELVFMPLAMRTERYLQDARAAALPWR